MKTISELSITSILLLFCILTIGNIVLYYTTQYPFEEYNKSFTYSNCKVLKVYDSYVIERTKSTRYEWDILATLISTSFNYTIRVGPLNDRVPQINMEFECRYKDKILENVTEYYLTDSYSICLVLFNVFFISYFMVSCMKYTLPYFGEH